MQNIVIIGGAGYVGKNLCAMLAPNYKVIAVDTDTKKLNYLKTKVPNVYTADPKELISIIDKNSIVIYLAGEINARESLNTPIFYYNSNISNLIQVLDIMNKKECNSIVFASSAAVYKSTCSSIIQENNEIDILSPYALSKYVDELMLQQIAKYSKLNVIVLRIFNIAGAGDFGEDHTNETHLIPSILQVALGKKQCIPISIGFETKDTSAVRDYVHVLDVCTAFEKSIHELESLKINAKYGMYNIFNVCTGKGKSTLEILKICEKVTNKKIPITIVKNSNEPRILIGNNTKIKTNLKWEPIYSLYTLKIIQSAWEYMQKG